MENALSRIINPESSGKERTRLTKAIVLAVRELAQQTRPGVLLTIQEYQDTLPEAYTAESYQTEVQFGVLVCVRGVLAVSVRYFQDIMPLEGVARFRSPPITSHAPARLFPRNLAPVIRSTQSKVFGLCVLSLMQSGNLRTRAMPKIKPDDGLRARP